ncbi:efflux transporter outer membrane subunit [Acidovorax sp. NCPPB 3576]|uniref:efflux transporter outer membrane subunit n=1 Tax=Acidovorax sp. NCPPB 3576 TaxID=2940488 RepID=UPI00234B94E9|nr:efflux transporter outer membrane subunit [Acidovorax sp. NCPPB 3576]WCM89470.1 efflux transporter outer membrane subunit [Acidovorax sp. NCPPB 3576]
MFRTRPVLLTLVAALSAGCAVGPDYVRPVPAMPDAYQGDRGPAWQNRGAALADADLALWWPAFGDPQLTRFVALALEQNLELSQASARVLQARAGLQAAGAALAPTVGVAAQASRAYQSVETPLGQVLNSAPGFDRYGSAYEANLSASWELDFFGGLERGRQAARAEFEGSQAGAAAVRLAVAAQTADVYLMVRGLQARIEVARRQVQTQQRLLSMIELRFNKGLAAELQLRQAEGALVRAKASIPVLQAAQEAAMNAMDVMLGTHPGTHRAELSAPRPLPALPQIASGGAPGDLLRRRPDLIAAERQLAARSARIGVAVAEYYPKVSLGGLLGSATSISSGHLFTGGAAQAGATVGLRWRLFDFGRIDAQIRFAEAQEAEALAGYRHAVLRATEEVENALSSFQRRQEQADLLAAAADSLTRVRAASAAAFDKGVVSLIEVLQADEALLGVLDGQAQAQTESARSAVAIFKALGGGWAPENASAPNRPQDPAAPPAALSGLSLVPADQSLRLADAAQPAAPARVGAERR